MHQDRDFDTQRELPQQEPALAHDLELNTLLGAMAGEDKFVFDVARRAMFSGFQNDISTILYRQEVVKDCLKNPAQIRELYAIAVEAFEGKRKYYISVLRHYPAGVLYDAINGLQFFTVILKKLRKFADSRLGVFESKGLTTLLAMLQTEFSDEYFFLIQKHLRELKFRGGVLVSAGLGKGTEGINFVLRQPIGKQPNWLQRLFGKGPPSYTFCIGDRDEAGAQILSEMQDRGINLVGNALAQSTDHILNFFDMLRTELAFYIGCLNLHERLVSNSTPKSFPRPDAAGTRRQCFSALRDVCLVLTMQGNVVGNDLHADGKGLVIITGANQGGKSSYLRSIGLAQIMMQCGMFVAAESFAAEICPGLFTHYRREEDATMKSGKLDEELDRISDIIDVIPPDSMLLFNESFASTNEREGSEIAAQIVRALVERRIKVLFVTHLYEFSHGLFASDRTDCMFLRAERRTDGTRTFKLVEGEPLDTSYGEDLYQKVFAA
jgi:hypothetical protein